jgi:transcriptional regulator with XRE-family HTH domain
MSDPSRKLADFLRLKRELLRPETIGLLDVEQRATADFVQRSDIASALGVPLAVYDNLENGVGNRPSERLLRALVEVLELTEIEAHAPPEPLGGGFRPRPVRAWQRPGLRA